MLWSTGLVALRKMWDFPGLARSKGEKERYKHLNSEFQRIARRDKKAFSEINSKKYRKITEWVTLEISSKNFEISRDHFMQRWAR